MIKGMNISFHFVLFLTISSSSSLFAAPGEQIQIKKDAVIDQEYLSVELPTMNPPGNKAVVYVVPGGRVTMVMSANDAPVVNLRGGYIKKLNAYDQTMFNLYSGECESLDADYIAHLYGGFIYEVIARPNSMIHVYGHGFVQGGISPNGGGGLSGFWANGQPFSITFIGTNPSRPVFNYNLTLHEVPLTLLSPNGGETIIAESLVAIMWQPKTEVGSVFLEYSIDSGLSWTQIAEVSNTDRYVWQVPQVESAHCLVRITNSTTPTWNDTSDTEFTICKSSLNITSPRPGNTLAGGKIHRVSWNAHCFEGDIILKFSPTGLSPWTSVAVVQDQTGFDWLVPEIESDSYSLMISKVGNPSITDITGPFTVCVPSLKLESPNGGEVLTAGTTHDIDWTSHCDIDSVRIEYSIDNGLIWKLIETVTNTGTYHWQVPIENSQKCLLRISELSLMDVTDRSDTTFTIRSGSLHLLSPNGGEELLSGSSHRLMWESQGIVEHVFVEYTLDGGHEWNTIGPITNTGSYDWTVPIANSHDCFIRLKDADYPVVADTSDNPFRIYTGAIQILSPNGGEAAVIGAPFRIEWQAIGSIPEILIEYSPNSGLNWYELARTPNTGSYSWNVIGPESNQYLLRLTDVAFSEIIDVSDGPFIVASCQEPIPGDVNGDCLVNFLDLAVLAENWLRDGFVRVFFQPFDSNPGWLLDGQWAFGQPTGGGGGAGNPDPSSGITGVNVYGVNLNGNYTVAVGGPYSLTAGPFNCRSFHDLKLKFARWLNTDGPNYVLCTVDVSSDGTTWTSVWQNDSVVTDNNWVPVEYDVSSIADHQEMVFFRWTYTILHDRAYPYSGWNIDDIEIYGKR